MTGPLAGRLEGTKVVIVAGSGGVGKTTTSAALAMGLAAGGRRVAVVTIDPARRLASSLGLEELGNEPRLVDPARFASHGMQMRGELWAMQLDAKRTFDELVDQLAPDARARDEVLGNRIYRELSSAVAGSQEFTAIAKLYDLDREGGFDVLVLDTPPSRNALDFLDAPDRLTGFLDGRALRLLLAPTGLAARVMGRGTGVVSAVLRRLTGVDLLEDVSVFLRSIGALLDGFRTRAAGVKELLGAETTTFLIVASPERGAVEEAIFFHGRLRDAGLPFGGLIVNRVHAGVAGDPPPDAVAAELAPSLGEALAAKVAASVRDAGVLARRDAEAIARLRTEIGVDDPVLVPQLDRDVHDVDALVLVERYLRD